MKMKKRIKPVNKFILFALITIFSISCDDALIPKPLGYYRIDFPEKQYIKYQGNCPYTFEYPKRSLLYDKIPGKPGCWMNLHYPQYGATIHFTYNQLEGENLGKYIEDSRKLVMKHIVKADDILENMVSNKSENVYGLTYDFSGNTATIYQFFITDSSNHFLRGSMYFNLPPNPDSLAPVSSYIKKDLTHFINTFKWKAQ